MRASLIFVSVQVNAIDINKAYQFDIPAQSLVKSLGALSQTTELLFLFPYDLVETKESKPLYGFYTAQKALDLLLAGSGLQGELSNNETFVVKPIVLPKNNVQSGMKDRNNEMKAQKTIIASIFAMLFAPAHGAEEANNEAKEVEQTEKIVVVGSRAHGRTEIDSAVPVDIIPLGEVMKRSGQIDLNTLLHMTSPSFNANRQQGSDGADHIDPASLRGLGPDQVLILINGKRRHTSSLVNIFGSSGRGNVGTDLNAIPISAVQRIEVLRDGAAAQYGSDAIAGVINIVLKSTPGTQASVQIGQYNTEYNGPEGKFSPNDGDTKQAYLSHTMEVGDGGFLNLSLDYQTRENTDRTYGVGDEPLREIGSAAVDSTGAFFNFSLPVFNDVTDFYMFGGISRKDGVADAFTRTADSSRNILEIYPNGYVPAIESDIEDNSFAIGIKTVLNNWDVDFSNTYGSNRFEYGVSNTLNVSYGASSPTEFKAGGFKFIQDTVNLDFSQYFDVLEGLNVAFGFEYRDENYSIFAGEEASYSFGGETLSDGVTPSAVGSQGFGGFQPNNVLDKSRNSYAAYVDFEIDITDEFMIGTAVRAEDYSDFGSALIGKIVARWNVSDTFTLRGGFNTGFRAPSLHQQYFNQTFTDVQLDPDTGNLIVQEELMASNDSEIARTLGVPELDAEDSSSMSIGFTWQPIESVSVTVDTYKVSVDDRVVLTKSISQARLAEIGTQEALEAKSFLESQGVESVQFFVNAIDTETQGVDLTVSHDADISGGHLKSFLGLNYNDTDVVGEPKTPEAFSGLEGQFLARRERLFIESGIPKVKGSLGMDYEYNNFVIGGQLSYFGEVHHGASSGDLADDQLYSPKATLDLSFTHKVTDNISWTLGANNITDEYPDEQDPNLTSGALWRSVQMGVNGRFLYLRTSLDF